MPGRCPESLFAARAADASSFSTCVDGADGLSDRGARREIERDRHRGELALWLITRAPTFTTESTSVDKGTCCPLDDLT